LPTGNCRERKSESTKMEKDETRRAAINKVCEETRGRLCKIKEAGCLPE